MHTASVSGTSYTVPSDAVEHGVRYTVTGSNQGISGNEVSTTIDDIAPRILAAGYLNTQVTESSGGTVDILVLTDGPDVAPEQVLLGIDGEAQELALTATENGAIYSVVLPRGTPPSSLLLSFHASDEAGNEGPVWPYLVVE